LEFVRQNGNPQGFDKLRKNVLTMIITFKPLQETHFPLLLKWLETPHVKQWWDEDVVWTLELIKENMAVTFKDSRLSMARESPYRLISLCG